MARDKRHGGGDLNKEAIEAIVASGKPGVTRAEDAPDAP